MADHRIIGLAGTFASGKDTLAHYLVREYNYLHVSTGDMVRQEALKQHGSIERPVLLEVANQERGKHGAGVFAELAIRMFEVRLDEGDGYDGVVISGLRTTSEAQAIKAAGGTLVFVDAPIEIRYQRMVGRNRDTETQLSLEEFKRQEAKELQSSGGDESQSILGVRAMADIVLINNADLEAFLTAARQKLNLL